MIYSFDLIYDNILGVTEPSHLVISIINNFSLGGATEYSYKDY